MHYSLVGGGMKYNMVSHHCQSVSRTTHVFVGYGKLVAYLAIMPWGLFFMQERTLISMSLIGIQLLCTRRLTQPTSSPFLRTSTGQKMIYLRYNHQLLKGVSVGRQEIRGDKKMNKPKGRDQRLLSVVNVRILGIMQTLTKEGWQIKRN